MQHPFNSLPHLLEQHLTLLSSEHDRAELVRSLKSQILPSFGVMQSAVVSLIHESHLIPLYCSGLSDDDHLPSDEDISFLINQIGEYRPHKVRRSGVCPWARLILPIRTGHTLYGFWLLGRRDPDRPYRKTEISALQIIAYYVSLLLITIDEKDRIRAIYQVNIDRNELERKKLARDLHDDLLNQLAVIALTIDDRGKSPVAIQRIDDVIKHVRQMVSALRPGMLDYGIRAALEGLVGELSYVDEGSSKLMLEVPRSEVRYEDKIEENIFRIVQEACENALRHAQAQIVRISGKFEPGAIELLIADNGVGFSFGDRSQMTQWLKNKHFGLAGMVERADLIGAELKINSIIGRGTQVSVKWLARNSSDECTGSS